MSVVNAKAEFDQPGAPAILFGKRPEMKKIHH
jgi:hypothetical protein